MQSSGLLLQLMCASAVTFICCGQAWSDDAAAEGTGSSEKQLVEAMNEILGRFQSRFPSLERRGTLPTCGVGQRCAMRLGPRIGRLCDCSRGGHCNSYLLKCI
nr:cocaine- and amphetamine-regulated transcript protein-like [Paramormyrops kingsleyae]